MNRQQNNTAIAAVWKIKLGDVEVHGIGDRIVLERKCLGLICSVQCPGSVVIQTFDAIRALRDAGIVIAGGFQSPMEKECLEFLLRGKQPVIVVLAKTLTHPRLPKLWKESIDAGRLLLISPLAQDIRRTTKVTALRRNQFIADHATAIWIPHATVGGQAEAIASHAISMGKNLYTFIDNGTNNLERLGAFPFAVDVIMRQ